MGKHLAFFATVALAASLSAAEWRPEDAVWEVRDRKSGLVHPGIGMTRDDVLRLAKFVEEGVEPWKSDYMRLAGGDHRFSMKPRIFSRRTEGITKIDSPDFDNRCAWDSQSAFVQAVLYIIDGDMRHREYAMDVVRWFYTNITDGHRHWDSQFRWPNAERWYLMAAEMLRYSGPKTGPLAWTDEDTKGVERFIAIGQDFWWGRGTFLNQLHFALGGPMSRAIWRNDRAMYDEMVEILTYNAQGPAGEGNGSIREMCRLVTTNEVDGAKVHPHVQFSEMGRDIGHPFPGAGALADNIIIVHSQGTRVDPVTGTVSTKKNAVDPIEFLGHRFLRGVNQICKYNLGFDIEWTPIWGMKSRGWFWDRPSNLGGGRGRIAAQMDILYNHYRWKRHLDFSKSEEKRYIGYANRLRGPDPFYRFLWMPKEAAGKWKDESIDPGHDMTNRFSEFIQPKMEGLSVKSDSPTGPKYVSSTQTRFMFPMFLPFRYPLPKPGEYVIRYRSEKSAGMAVINPAEYDTEFEDPKTMKKRKYAGKVRLPPTSGAWRELKFELKEPPARNLIKLEFRTNGGKLDLEWIKAPR